VGTCQWNVRHRSVWCLCTAASVRHIVVARPEQRTPLTSAHSQWRSYSSPAPRRTSSFFDQWTARWMEQTSAPITIRLDEHVNCWSGGCNKTYKSITVGLTACFYIRVNSKTCKGFPAHEYETPIHVFYLLRLLFVAELVITFYFSRLIRNCTNLYYGVIR